MFPSINAGIESSSVEAQWTAPSLIPELPFPGTKEFGRLIQVLEPYGLDASKISVETPSNRVSDVELRIALRAVDLDLSLLYTGFRIGTDRFLDSHREPIGKLAAITAALILPSAGLVPGGKFSVRYHGHLRLNEGSRTDFLRSLLGHPSGLDPTGASFLFDPPTDANVAASSVLVEHSKKIDGGLYVRCDVDFEAVGDLESAAKRAFDTIAFGISSTGIVL